ncbi:hypothetical protein QQF64_012708 [Cirrhinus molitorella]|uniref:Uncharacterized protein n=1 Tax=Cirrhinus molitorella TaxID=172907 RepID=A0ABR3M0C8_9TELE
MAFTQDKMIDWQFYTLLHTNPDAALKPSLHSALHSLSPLLSLADVNPPCAIMTDTSQPIRRCICCICQCIVKRIKVSCHRHCPRAELDCPLQAERGKTGRGKTERGKRAELHTGGRYGRICLSCLRCRFNQTIHTEGKQTDFLDSFVCNFADSHFNEGSNIF